MISFHSVYSEHRIEKRFRIWKMRGRTLFMDPPFDLKRAVDISDVIFKEKKGTCFHQWFLQKSTLFNDHQRCPFLYVCFMWKCFSIVSENLVECVFQCKEHDHSREQGLLTVPLITGEIQQGGVGGRGTKKSRKKLLDWYNNTKHEMWYPEPFYHIGTSYQKLKFQ